MLTKTTPTSTAETVEVGGNHGFGLEPHPKLRTLIADGAIGLAGCADPAQIVD